MKVVRVCDSISTNKTIGFLVSYTTTGRNILLTQELTDYVEFEKGEVLGPGISTYSVRASDFTPSTIRNLYNTLPIEEAEEFAYLIPCETIVDLIHIGAPPSNAEDEFYNRFALEHLFHFIDGSNIVRCAEYHPLIIAHALECMKHNCLPPRKYEHVWERSFLIDAIHEAQKEERHVILMLLWAHKSKNKHFKNTPIHIMRYCLIPLIKITLNYTFKISNVWIRK
jgi:hypothetical protein